MEGWGEDNERVRIRGSSERVKERRWRGKT